MTPLLTAAEIAAYVDRIKSHERTGWLITLCATALDALRRAEEAEGWPGTCIHGAPVEQSCVECQMANLALQTPEVEAVAWDILEALHENVPEQDRPMSWSDMRRDQELRIRRAAHAAVRRLSARKERRKNERA
jgi:hypothetical protein